MVVVVVVVGRTRNIDRCRRFRGGAAVGVGTRCSAPPTVHPHTSLCPAVVVVVVVVVISANENENGESAKDGAV